MPTPGPQATIGGILVVTAVVGSVSAGVYHLVRGGEHEMIGIVAVMAVPTLAVVVYAMLTRLARAQSRRRARRDEE